VLGIVEIKELAVFPGFYLAGYEGCMAQSGADDTMLENPGSCEGTSWLRRYQRPHGEDGMETRADHRNAATGCQA
jgi:hypothetical protein